MRQWPRKVCQEKRAGGKVLPMQTVQGMVVERQLAATSGKGHACREVGRERNANGIGRHAFRESERMRKVEG